jgi:hypothetical protein
MNIVEVAIILRAGPGGVPLILARIQNHRLLRDALGQAITAAEYRADHGGGDPFAAVAARQEVEILRGLLAHVGEASSALVM